MNKVTIKNFTLLVFVYGILAINYNCSNSNKKIEDIWIGDYYYPYLEGFAKSIPYILDLSNISNCKLINYRGDTVFLDYNPSDSILLIDSNKYNITSITSDRLILSSLKDQVNFIFKRIVNRKVEKTNNARQTLTNKIWQIQHTDSIINRFYNKIDFLDNGIAIFSMPNDTSDLFHLQEECWKVLMYKNFSFLFFYHNGIQGSIEPRAYQIIELKKDQFTIDMRGNKHSVFNLLTPKSSELSKQLIGTWISINDTCKFYNKYLSKRIGLYSDTLTYIFNHDSLIMIGKGFENSCNWYLNSDQTILIYEYPYIDEYCEDTIYVEYAKFLETKEDNFKVELFYNFMDTGKSQPRQIALNRYQNFKRR